MKEFFLKNSFYNFVIFKNENFIFEITNFLITGMQEPPLKTWWYEWNVWEPTLWKPSEIVFDNFLKPCPSFYLPKMKIKKTKEPSQIFKSILIPQTRWFSKKPKNHQTLVNSMTTKVPFSSWVSLENYVRGIAKSTPLLFMCWYLVFFSLIWFLFTKEIVANFTKRKY